MVLRLRASSPVHSFLSRGGQTILLVLSLGLAPGWTADRGANWVDGGTPVAQTAFRHAAFAGKDGQEIVLVTVLTANNLVYLPVFLASLRQVEIHRQLVILSMDEATNYSCRQV